MRNPDRETTFAILLYVALSTVFCWPLFAQPLANAHGDWDQHIFWYAAVLKNAAFGDLPFWNPWYCGGNVLWANPQASLVSPVYLLALVMPLTLAMKINVLAHYVIGCLGMHQVIRRMVGVRSIAVTAFLVTLFVFAGGIALHVKSGHTVYLPVLFLPWIVYFFWKAAAGHLRSLLAGAAVFGFSLLNGGMHVVPFVVVVLGALGLGALVFGRHVKPLLLGLAMFGLGCAYAAPKVIPAMAFIRSPDFHDVRPVKEPDYMSLEMLRISLFDATQDTSVKVSPGVQLYGWHEYGNYLGWFGALMSFVGALWILLFRRWRSDWRAGAAALALVIVVLLTAGEFAVWAPASLMRAVPLLSSFRIPSRFTMLVPLFGAICAAFAAQWLEQLRHATGWRRAAEILCIVGAVQLVFVNRAHLKDVFILPADAQSRLFDRISPTVAAQEVVTPGGPRVHRTFLLDSMLAGVSPLSCYEPLQVQKIAYPGPVAVRGEGDVTISDPAFSPNRVEASAAVGGQAARAILNQNAAQGWATNLGPAEPDPASRQPSVRLPAGYSGRIVFTFTPPGLWLGLVLWAFVVASSFYIWRTQTAGV